MEAEPACKAEILRGIVVEKLTTAAREIFAVVERTVAGYEEEASGLRQEIDRQRRQLEVLQQPRVKLEITDDQFPVCELVAGRGAEPPEEEEEQHKYEPNDQFLVCEPVAGGGAEAPQEEEHQYEQSVEDVSSLGLICYTEVQMEEHEEEEHQERLAEPRDEAASRSSTPTVRSDRRSVGRPRISQPQDHIDFRIRVLDDPQIKVLSVSTFKKYPARTVRCPGGLQEADFLDLLRSTFPLLAARTPFQVMISNRTRLLPLKVKTLTPEEIYRSIRSTGHSALYIRVKNMSSENEAAVFETQEDLLKSTDEEFHPSQRHNAAAESPSTPDQTRILSPRVQTDRKNPGRRQSSELKNLVDLRIRILEPQTNVLSPKAFRKYPVLELQCPGGLQEADFLDLLRSTFPQLASQKPFDFFTIDRTKRLQPLRVKTLTPEEISESTGPSGLYIRLKAPERVQTREREAVQRKDSSSTDQTRLNTRAQSDRRKSGRPRVSEPQNHVDLRVCILEDPRINVLSPTVYKKYAVQDLRCPGGLQEADFLDLLRSTFPQLAARTPFDVFTTDKTKRLQPLRVKTLTPEEISGSSGFSALYLRLKAQEEVQTGEEELRHADAVKDPSSTSDQTRLNTSSRPQHEDEERDEDGGRSASAVSRLWSLLVLSDTDGDGGEVSDDDWRADRRGKHLREDEPEKTPTRKRRGKSSDTRTMSSTPRASSENGEAPLSCKVCRSLRSSTNMMIKHAWSHVDHPGRLCGVCGEHSASAEELRNHLQSHQKTHSCNICGKSFLSLQGFNGHVARHKGKKPHKCSICHKAFAEKWVLRNHEWIHTADKPHKCHFCQKSCVSKFDLARHLTTHTGEKLHRCDVCGKSLSSLGSLSKHMLRHLGHSVRETAFACEVCGRTFHTSRKLKLHMRKHSAAR